MFDSCLSKQASLKALFEVCTSEEAKYAKIIELGKSLPDYPIDFRKEEYLVKGCQSQMYLHSKIQDGVVSFEVHSDALISAGLAAILLFVYNNESPETILKCPPSFLDELGIQAKLTPSRANGLYSVHLRMKQEALKHLLGS
jgi:cysteine desulfuration protein SufE